MFPSKSLLALVFIALSAVDASPLTRRDGKASLAFTTIINQHGTLGIAQKDRARAQVMKQAGHLGKRSRSISVADSQVSFTAQVGVGSPPTYYTLLIDTGSSNTFVGADKRYISTSSSKDTGNGVSISYGSGSWFGEEWIDTVTLGAGLVINQQSIGVAAQTTGFDDVDGILGVGPVGLTEGTVANTATVPTVLDNLFAQGTISEEVLGVYFVPASESNSNGELTFGGYDSSVITSSVEYVPFTTTSPASEYWGIDIQSITYGSKAILSSTAGIVDTGTTLILIATDAFQEYQSQTGAVMDPTTGLLRITPIKYVTLKPLTFNIGSKSYALTPDGQIWPRSLNPVIGGSSSSIYLVVNDIGTKSGYGLDYIIGYAFLERYYSVFDTTKERVGFASTLYTASISNYILP